VEAPGSNHKHMDDLKKELTEKGLPNDDEHCVIHAMFPAQLEKHYAPKEAPAPAAAPAPAQQPVQVSAPAAAPASYTSVPGRVTRLSLKIEGKQHDVSIEELL
ncbi:MAG: pyruvate carboxylase subunit B, partial [Puniceicoccales bacterium]